MVHGSHAEYLTQGGQSRLTSKVKPSPEGLYCGEAEDENGKGGDRCLVMGRVLGSMILVYCLAYT